MKKSILGLLPMNTKQKKHYYFLLKEKDFSVLPDSLEDSETADPNEILQILMNEENYAAMLKQVKEIKN